MGATASQPAARQMRQVKFMLPSDHQYEPIPVNVSQDAHRRIAGIIPLIVKRINAFSRSMRPRELAQFDIQDLVQELWAALLEKDCYYDATQAKYTTWATYVISQQLGAIRNRCHVVESPRDTANRLKAPESNQRLIGCIRQAISEVSSFCPEVHDVQDTCMLPSESDLFARPPWIEKLLDHLPSMARRIIALKYGLGKGTMPKDMRQIAIALGPPMTASRVGRVAAAAEKRLLQIAEAEGLEYTSVDKIDDF